MEFDDLFEYIGEFGLYQLMLFLTLGLLSFYPGWQNMGMAVLGEWQPGIAMPLTRCASSVFRLQGRPWITGVPTRTWQVCRTPRKSS